MQSQDAELLVRSLFHGRPVGEIPPAPVRKLDPSDPYALENLLVEIDCPHLLVRRPPLGQTCLFHT